MQRYVVVGGGLAGLTAANALAGAGHSVALLEQSESLGGRAATKHDHGFLLNFGPHALYQAGVAAETLRSWNVPFSGGAPDISRGAFFVRDRKKYPLVHTARGLLTT